MPRRGNFTNTLRRQITLSHPVPSRHRQRKHNEAINTLHFFFTNQTIPLISCILNSLHAVRIRCEPRATAVIIKPCRCPMYLINPAVVPHYPCNYLSLLLWRTCSRVVSYYYCTTLIALHTSDNNIRLAQYRCDITALVV